MDRHQQLNNVFTKKGANESMFSRHLSSVGSNWLHPTQASSGCWGIANFPRYPCWTVQPPRHHPLLPSRFLSGALRPHEPLNWSRAQQASPGRFYPGYHQQFIHLSNGLMERPDREPLPKRRRSADDKLSADGSHKPSRQETSPQQPLSYTASPNFWLKNGARNSSLPRATEDTSLKSKQTPAIRRKWEDFSRTYDGSTPRGQPFDFSVMSYNILSQELLHDNAYLYRHCSAHVLNWGHRFANIRQEVEQHRADILCLQEVQKDHYESQIKPSLETLGYHCEYKKRTGRKPDGCAVAFRRERFSLESVHPVEYFRQGVSLLDRDNVGMVLLLRPTGPSGAGRRLCVANTHLLFNPRRGDIKLAQLAVLLAEISSVARLPDSTSCPVLLCGDFNSVPWSPLYSFIRDRRLEYDGLLTAKVSGQEGSPRSQRVLSSPIWPLNLGITHKCQYKTLPTDADLPRDVSPATEGQEGAAEALNRPSIEHSLTLSSTYSHLLKEGRGPEITTCHARTAITVDYIFYTAARGDVSLQPECSAGPERGLLLLGRLELVSEADLRRVNGLPNEHNSSDHLPLLARFRLCP